MVPATKTIIRVMVWITLLFLGLQHIEAQERWLHVYYQTEKKATSPFTNLLIPFSGGGYLSAGPPVGTHPVCILRTDVHGNLLWVKQYAKNGYIWRLLDNGDGTFTFYIPSAMLITANADGEILSKVGYAFSYGGGTDVTRSSNGDYYFLNQNLTLTKVDGKTLAPIWLIEYDPAPTPYAIQATPDGGIVMLGSLNATPNGTELIKVDSDGNVEWAHRYEGPAYGNQPVLASMADGSLVLAYYAENCCPSVVMHLDPSGDILWQEELTFPDYPTMGPATIQAIRACQDGTILLSGLTGGMPGGQYPSGWPMLEALDSSGTPLWCQLYGNQAIAPDSSIYNTLASQDGYVFMSQGRDESQWPMPYGVSLSSVDLSGNAPEACASQPLAVAARPTSLSALDCPITPRSWPGTTMISIDVHQAKDVTGIRDDLICGDVFPGVMNVKPLQNPFRLKLTGWNFQDGSVGFINGVQVPSSAFKGTEAKTRQTRMDFGGGSRLKAMLPKGQAVTITIQNPDGNASAGFSFTR